MLRLVQRLLQRLFLLAERAANAVFGDRLNPLYHLGALSYWLFWVVVASGLYLYAFFDTSVTGAYLSVEHLTHDQRWAGGIMRSLHRYASDGMVLTMALHLARHFAFDRHRGFRWFSWVSGVLLLWLVYASGINGYMLPWDQLAQFTVVATAEWFDAIPVFNGLLVRNFLTVDSVNDRFFSLLSFLHIGLPLGVMALLWIHTHRVPQAKTSPPRALMLGLGAAMLALSLAKPALSQAPADLATTATAIGFDWFYLPTYALLYEWSPSGLWILTAGLTLLAVLAPWLPPKFGRREVRGFHVLANPDNRIVPVKEDETLLDACLREGLAFPFDCRNGGCGVCKCSVLHGEVELGPYQESALTAAEREAGRVLACVAKPLSDVEIAYEPTGRAARQVAVHEARVASMDLLAPDVMRVRLELENGERIPFYAGQYINILLEDGQKRAFSFATAPHEPGPIELHIRRIEGGRFTSHVFTAMKAGDRLRFEGPVGSFFLREDGEKPVIFVAGATGFAPVKSMVEHAFHAGVRRPMVLYWGTRRLADMYLRELPERWEKEHPNFRFVPVLSEPAATDAWEGRTGLVHEAILADYPDLAGHRIYACGSVKMVEAAQPAFAKQGLSPDDCFSDAFKLAPRIHAEEADLVRLGGRA
jgi:NAD(P)H-flavin reductase/quinol-cytochrome oxidoreductase complex cytochrome b subunit/ferredoxin